MRGRECCFSWDEGPAVPGMQALLSALSGHRAGMAVTHGFGGYQSRNRSEMPSTTIWVPTAMSRMSLATRTYR
jgi:hypothetical protein